MTPLKSVCVYCGSADGLAQEYLSAAWQMGRVLAENKITVVYGGGKTGLMGALADGVLAGSGDVVGVIPENMNLPQLAHAGLTRLEVLPDIHQRKARMVELAQAFIAMPGGFGTFDELFECLTWSQVGLHHKPIGLLNTQQYFDPLLAMVRHAMHEGFIYGEHRCLMVHHEDPAILLTMLEEFERPGNLNRWMERDSN
jgi:hypothetical protein